MALKIVLLLVCCLIAVNSFSVQSSEDRIRSSSLSLTGYGVRSRESGSSEQEQFGHRQVQGMLGQSVRNYQGQYDGLGGQKLKVKYPGSSSSSSEENSSESYEIRKVEKQYHDTNGYNNGNSHWEPGETQSRNYKMNFEASDLQNAIEKDM